MPFLIKATTPPPDIAGHACMSQTKQHPLYDFSINTEEFTLGNGLRVIVSEDKSQDDVRFDVLYFTGSKDEKEGKTGLAHLMEHMMHRPLAPGRPDFYEAMRELGSGINAATGRDITVFMSGGAREHFEEFLWLEAERMGKLAPSLTQENLDEERGVVINELLQQTDPRTLHMQAYGYPAHHPYSWSVIGSIKDLKSIELEDLRQWHSDNYGPNNAALIICGNISAEEAQPIIEKYFGWIPPSPPFNRLKSWHIKRTEALCIRKETDKGPLELQRAWFIPGVQEKGCAEFELLAQCLNMPQYSPLHKRLMEDLNLVSAIRCPVFSSKLCSTFSIIITAKADANEQELRRELNHCIEELKNWEVPQEALDQCLQERYIEQITNAQLHLGQRIVFLMESLSQGSRTDFYQQKNRWYCESTPQDLLSSTREWLQYEPVETIITPRPKLIAGEMEEAARPPRAVKQKPEINSDFFERYQLANGINVKWIKETRAAFSQLQLSFNEGSASADPQTRGCGEVLIKQLNSHLGRVSEPASFKALGAKVFFLQKERSTTLHLSGLSANLGNLLSLLPQVFFNAEYEDEALTPSQLSAAQKYRSQLVYGKEHPYGAVADKDISAATLLRRHQQIFRPENLTIAVASNLNGAKLCEFFEKYLGQWPLECEAQPLAQLPAPQPETQAKCIIFDEPEAPQSELLVCRVKTWESPAEKQALLVANQFFGTGGGLTDTVLRQKNGWTYGVYSSFDEQPEQCLWSTRGSVQKDKTAAATTVILAGIKKLFKNDPLTTEALKEKTDTAIDKLAFIFNSIERQLGSIKTLCNNHSGKDIKTQVEEAREAIEGLTPESVERCWEAFAEGDFRIIINGDSKAILEDLQALNLGNIEVRNADNQLISA